MKTWEDILEACRNHDKAALAVLGKDKPPVRNQDVITDGELIKQIQSLGSFYHPHFDRLVREAYQRWNGQYQSPPPPENFQPSDGVSNQSSKQDGTQQSSQNQGQTQKTYKFQSFKTKRN